MDTSNRITREQLKQDLSKINGMTFGVNQLPPAVLRVIDYAAQSLAADVSEDVKVVRNVLKSLRLIELFVGGTPSVKKMDAALAALSRIAATPDSKNLDQLAAEQGVTPVDDVAKLRGDGAEDFEIPTHASPCLTSEERDWIGNAADLIEYNWPEGKDEMKCVDTLRAILSRAGRCEHQHEAAIRLPAAMAELEEAEERIERAKEEAKAQARVSELAARIVGPTLAILEGREGGRG